MGQETSNTLMRRHPKQSQVSNAEFSLHRHAAMRLTKQHFDDLRIAEYQATMLHERGMPAPKLTEMLL